MKNTCCFTGHRPNKLGGYNESNPIMSNVRDKLHQQIAIAIEDGYTNFISGMAIGVDMIAAELVIKIRDTYHKPIRLITAVPFVGQECMWNKQTQQRYHNILGQSDVVKIISTGKYAAYKMQIRNKWMVDHSSRIIAVWDGSSGGTGNCIIYANCVKHELQIIRINP